MEYKVESSLLNFPAWSGGKDTLDLLINRDDCDAVEEFIEQMFYGDVPTETDINDLLWFDADAIAEHLGYEDWEAYEDGWSLEDLKEAEDWFDESEFDFLAELAGIKREDYVNGEDDDDFVDAIQEWWDDKSNKEKVEIYNDNQ